LVYADSQDNSYNLNDKHLFTLYNNNITRGQKELRWEHYQYKGYYFHPPFSSSRKQAK